MEITFYEVVPKAIDFDQSALAAHIIMLAGYSPPLIRAPYLISIFTCLYSQHPPELYMASN